jgi:hypothetical protein
MEHFNTSISGKEEICNQSILADFFCCRFNMKRETLSDTTGAQLCLETSYVENMRGFTLDDLEEWANSAIDELHELFAECSEKNWDGYNANPISIGTFEEAKNILAQIPSSFPRPDITPEPDGGVGLEWYKEPNMIFIVSVNGNHIIHYAGLFGQNNETHGKECFTGAIPEVIIGNLVRLFPKQKMKKYDS